MDSLVATIEGALRRHRFRYADERELQAGVEHVLRSAGLSVAREAALGALGVVDFLVDGLAVEVKVRGTRVEVVRQVHRYLQHEEVRGLLLITTRAALARVPATIAGKPVYAHHLVSGAF